MKRLDDTSSRFAGGRRQAAPVFLVLLLFSAGRLVMPGMAFSQDQSGNTHVAAAPSFREVFSTSHLAMLLIEPAAGRIVDANPAALQFYGYSHSRLTAMKIQEINRLTPAQVEEELTRAAREERNFFIFRHMVADGSMRTVEVTSQPYRFGDQSLLLSVIRDATSYRFLEEDFWYYQAQLEKQVDEQIGHIRRLQRITTALAIVFILILMVIIIYLLRTIRRLRAARIDLTHSNTILQEAHHRIKNNMNSVVGILTLQARKVGDRKAQTALEDTRNHVEGMMQLYDTLYRTNDLRQVPMDTYMEQLVNRLVSHFPAAEKVTVTTAVDPISLDGQIVAPLGIIVTELITNAMKYAFTDRDTGQLTVSLVHRDHRVTLIVEDDGPGIPETHDGTVEGFGLGLVRELTKTQLKGLMSRENRGRQDMHGTRVVVEFKT